MLAQAVLEMFRKQASIGPAIENGFYYDFDLPRTLIPEDLPILEKKMKHIVKQNQKFVGREESGKKAMEFLKAIKQPFKVELLEDFLKEGKTITFYENIRGDGTVAYVDMCKGGHSKSTGEIGPFKLTKIAGAYWRGDEKRPQLQRIYGVCFETQAELDEHLAMLAE